MNQVERDEIYRLSGPRQRAYIDLLEVMGSAAMQFYLLNANMSHPPECLEQLRQAFVKLGWLDVVEDEDEDEDENEDQGPELHQCPYCYNMVKSEHEEFCPLNPNSPDPFKE